MAYCTTERVCEEITMPGKCGGVVYSSTCLGALWVWEYDHIARKTHFRNREYNIIKHSSILPLLATITCACILGHTIFHLLFLLTLSFLPSHPWDGKWGEGGCEVGRRGMRKRALGRQVSIIEGREGRK